MEIKRVKTNILYPLIVLRILFSCLPILMKEAVSTRNPLLPVRLPLFLHNPQQPISASILILDLVPLWTSSSDRLGFRCKHDVFVAAVAMAKAKALFFLGKVDDEMVARNQYFLVSAERKRNVRFPVNLPTRGCGRKGR